MNLSANMYHNVIETNTKAATAAASAIIITRALVGLATALAILI